MSEDERVTIVTNDNTIFNYQIVIRKDRDSVYIAECPALPGCVTDGATFEEALSMIKDAIRVYIGSKQELGEPIPSEREVFHGNVTVAL